MLRNYFKEIEQYERENGFQSPFGGSMMRNKYTVESIVSLLDSVSIPFRGKYDAQLIHLINI